MLPDVPAQALPDVSFVLRPNNEMQWTDLLAAVISTDPGPFAALLGRAAVEPVRVQREVAVAKESRPDLVVTFADGCQVVIEAKVLSPVDWPQLQRHAEQFPGAGERVVLRPHALFAEATEAIGWRTVSWEKLLEAYVESGNAWAAATARAWIEHLHQAMPPVHRDTPWNAVGDQHLFSLAMRRRVTWLAENVTAPDGVEVGVVPSSAGAAWILGLGMATGRPGYRIAVELEERLPVREIPRLVGPDQRQPRGPRALVALRQDGVRTSAGFDWDYLAELWPLMQAHTSQWSTTSPKPKAEHDRAHRQRLLAEGRIPPHLGAGYGEGQARRHHFCMFGARINYPADITMAALAEELAGVAGLVARLATHRTARPAVA